MPSRKQLPIGATVREGKYEVDREKEITPKAMNHDQWTLIGIPLIFTTGSFIITLLCITLK